MTEQQPYEQRPYPGYLMTAWAEAFNKRRAAEQVARELKALVTRENQARRAYADASAARTAKEAEHADLLEAAQGHEEMTALWCREHDRQLPPPPPAPALPAPEDGQTRPQALPAAVPAGVVPVWQEPPRADPLTDPPGPPPNGDVRGDTPACAACGGAIVFAEQAGDWVHALNGLTECAPGAPVTTYATHPAEAVPSRPDEDGDPPNQGRFHPETSQGQSDG